MSRNISEPWIEEMFCAALQPLSQEQENITNSDFPPRTVHSSKRFTIFPYRIVQVISVNEELRSFTISDTRHSVQLVLTGKCFRKIKEPQRYKFSLIVLRGYWATTYLQAICNRDQQGKSRPDYLPFAIACSDFSDASVVQLERVGDPENINLSKEVHQLIHGLGYAAIYRLLAVNQFPYWNGLPDSEGRFCNLIPFSPENPLSEDQCIIPEDQHVVLKSLPLYYSFSLGYDIAQSTPPSNVAIPSPVSASPANQLRTGLRSQGTPVALASPLPLLGLESQNSLFSSYGHMLTANNSYFNSSQTQVPESPVGTGGCVMAFESEQNDKHKHSKYESATKEDHKISNDVYHPQYQPIVPLGDDVVTDQAPHSLDDDSLTRAIRFASSTASSSSSVSSVPSPLPPSRKEDNEATPKQETPYRKEDNETTPVQVKEHDGQQPRRGYRGKESESVIGRSLLKEFVNGKWQNGRVSRFERPYYIVEYDDGSPRKLFYHQVASQNGSRLVYLPEQHPHLQTSAGGAPPSAQSMSSIQSYGRKLDEILSMEPMNEEDEESGTEDGYFEKDEDSVDTLEITAMTSLKKRSENPGARAFDRAVKQRRSIISNLVSQLRSKRSRQSFRSSDHQSSHQKGQKILSRSSLSPVLVRRREPISASKASSAKKSKSAEKQSNGEENPERAATLAEVQQRLLHRYTMN
eukprot:gene3712-4061_t